MIDELTAWRIARSGETCPAMIVSVDVAVPGMSISGPLCPHKLVYVRDESPALCCPIHGRVIEVDAA